jgi:hypothetical protein
MRTLAKSVDDATIESAFALGDHELVTALFTNHLGRLVRHVCSCTVCGRTERRMAHRILCPEGQELREEFGRFRARLVDIVELSTGPLVCRLLFNDGSCQDVEVKSAILQN